MFEVTVTLTFLLTKEELLQGGMDEIGKVISHYDADAEELKIEETSKNDPN